MPDFRIQPSFPMASVIDAAGRNAQLQQQAKEAGNRSLLEGLQSIGQVGESLLSHRKRIAQAMLLSQQPEVADMLSGGDRQVTQGLDGQPVRLDQTAQGGAGVEPKQNAPGLPPEKAALLLEGANPLEVLKQAFARKQSMKPVEDVVVKEDAAGNIIGYTRVSREKGAKTLFTGPQSAPRQSPAMSPDRAEFKIIDTFNANPQVRRQQQSIDGAEAVRELAMSDNPIAAAAIPTYMARASGEVGALSEPDKAPFGGSQAIMNKLEAALNQKVAGTLTDENRQFLLDLSDVMKRNAEQNLDRKGREFSDQYSKTKVGLKAPDIFKSLRPNSQYEVKQSTATLKEPESKDVLKVGGTFNGQKIVGVKLKKS